MICRWLFKAMLRPLYRNCRVSNYLLARALLYVATAWSISFQPHSLQAETRDPPGSSSRSLFLMDSVSPAGEDRTIYTVWREAQGRRESKLVHLVCWHYLKKKSEQSQPPASQLSWVVAVYEESNFSNCSTHRRIGGVSFVFSRTAGAQWVLRVGQLGYPSGILTFQMFSPCHRWLTGSHTTPNAGISWGLASCNKEERIESCMNRGVGGSCALQTTHCLKWANPVLWSIFWFWWIFFQWSSYSNIIFYVDGIWKC